jgi:putative copper resistance protein D
VIATLRFVHFAAVVLLAGGFAFFLCIARPALREWARADSVWRELREGPQRVARWCLALAFVSGILWFLLQTAEMSGTAVTDATEGETLATVLSATLFGRVWIARFALAAALGVALYFLSRAWGRRETAALVVCAALAAVLLATLAWTGHGTGEQGIERVVHLCADVVHLLAAGAWLGALPALALVLARAGRDASTEAIAFAARATQRFSTLGVASVAALIVTGAVNAWFTVGSVPALFGTGYGQLLCAKLALFAAMVALAAINRVRLTPRLSQPAPEPALAALRRNAIAETALGLAVLAIVGALGIMVPAPHVQTVWPFSHTLDWEAVIDTRRLLVAVFVVVFAAAAVIVLGMGAKRHEMTVAGIAAVVGAVIASAWMFAVPANPTTYFQSPVRYDVASVTRGGPLYAQHCAACHGRFGEGDGPSAKSLPARPPYLTASVESRREGDVLWWVEHGTKNARMPGVGDRVGEDQLWDLLNFLRAMANADAGRRLNSFADPWRPVTPPEFTFQIGKGTQESLAQLRGNSIVLLVFYTMPQSFARLRALTQAKPRLDRLGVRVIALPIAEGGAVPREVPGLNASMLAAPDASLGATYSMFTRTMFLPPTVPPHLEFLIDRQGYLRARWEPDRDQGWNEVSDLLRQAVILAFEKPRPPQPRRHAH